MKILVTGLFLLFFGCSSSTHKINIFYENKDISKSDLKGRIIFISPFCKISGKISNTSKIMREKYQDTNISENDLVETFNNEYITKKGVKFKYVKPLYLEERSGEFSNSTVDEDFVKIDKPLGKYNVEYGFKFPKKEYLKKYNIKPDLVLFLSDINVFIKDAEVKTGGGGHFQTSPGPISATIFSPEFWGSKLVPQMSTLVKFIIWDYINGDAIAYGQFQIEGGLDKKKINNSWKYISNKTVNKIRAKSGKIKKRVIESQK